MVADIDASSLRVQHKRPSVLVLSVRLDDHRHRHLL
jgi:hypothetical protein